MSSRLWTALKHLGCALGAIAVVTMMGIGADYCLPSASAASLDTPEATVPFASTPPAPSALAVHRAPDNNADLPSGFARLPGHVLQALAKATLLDGGADGTSPTAADNLTLTLVMKRQDQAGFERYMNDVYDLQSKNFRHFLSQQEITRRFGPSKHAYSQVLAYLENNGLRVLQRSKNRMTLTVQGTRAQVERAFALSIHDYRLGSEAFYANDVDPAMPKNLVSHVEDIAGLSSYAKPRASVDFVVALCVLAAAVLTLNAVNVANASAAAQAAAAASPALEVPAVLAELAAEAVGPAAYGAAAAGVICAAAGAGVYLGGVLDAATGGAPPETNPPLITPRPWVSRAWNAMQGFLGGPALNQAGPPGGVRPNLAAVRPSAASADGTGQTIGLLEFDTFNLSDISNYLAYTGNSAASIANLSVVPVNGGIAAPGADEEEVLLDINTAMAIATGAKIIVFDAPFTGHAADYSGLFNAMIDHGVTIISNSWASCEDQVSQAEVSGIDSVLQSAAASGISVFNGTGDGGSNCLDGTASTISVPADSPNATAVGGTSLTFAPGFTYGSETWWDGSNATPVTGQGGFGVSKFFSAPSYQTGLTTSAMRSIPDVSIDADPAHGSLLCQADAGGCPTGLFYGGTSMAAPLWAAFAARLNSRLGRNLGALNPQIYPLANGNAFHSAASMSSDFAHVGLGSPNISNLALSLAGQTVGTPDATLSEVSQYSDITPSGSVILASGGVPSDGKTIGVITVNLYDSAGNPVAGKTVTLAAGAGSHAVISPQSVTTSLSNGAANFNVTDSTPEFVSFTATDSTDGVTLQSQGAMIFVPPLAAAASINVAPTAVAADGSSSATIIVTLKDAANNPSPEKTVVIATGGSHAVVSGPSPAITDATGAIQFTATDQVSETVTFTATDVTDGLPVPGSGVVTYSGSTNTECGVGLVPVPGTGYQITPFATGFPAAPNLYYDGVNGGCPGARTPTFTSIGTVVITDALTGGLYQLGLAGGTASAATLLNTLSPTIGSPIYGKDGSLYAAIGSEGAEIVQLNATSGAIVRVVASGLTCPAGLSVDPLSGDLFFDDSCTGGGTDDPSVYRIIDPANTNASQPTSVVLYATLPTTPSGGMAFAPNGTLYAVSGYQVSGFASSQPTTVQQISGTNSATVTVAPVSGLTSDFSLAIGMTNPDGSAQSLIVEPNGALTEVPIANPSAAVVLAAGTLSDEVTGPGGTVAGPDGCLYFPHYDTIYKLSDSNGACQFSPTSPAPSLALTPATVSPNPSQGGSQTFTAQLNNVASAAGVPVVLIVGGANTQTKLSSSNTSGAATFAYTAAQSGTDNIYATAKIGGTTLTSNGVSVTWTAGPHLSALSLNAGPQGGMVAQPVNVVATLYDASDNPAAAIPNQTVTFTLGGVSCSATTNAIGTASCSLSPVQSGLVPLTAAFAGSAQYTAASKSFAFRVSTTTAAPTVTISANPVTVAAGSPLVITWSSTNATSCSASGAWNGTEPTTGSASVTPPASGNYIYTLTCSGAGGSSTASAAVAATLVAVTVTTKGGGAVDISLLWMLAMLVALRLAQLMRHRGTVFSIVLFGMLIILSTSSRAADSLAATDASASPTWIDPFYFGARAGYMPDRISAANIDKGLTAYGFDDVSAAAKRAGVAGTLFLGYEFTPFAALELGYTYRNARAAIITGNIPSAADLTPLLRDTTELVRGFGDIVSLSYAARIALAPQLSLEPRVGGFFWATNVVSIGFEDRVQATREGGGITVGVTLAYRVFRGLEFGIDIDHYRGFPNNIATLYGGSLEWRFGAYP